MAGHSVIRHMEHSSKTRSFTLDTKVPNLTKRFEDSKIPDRCLHVYSAQITSLQLNQVTLQPEFNFNYVTCIYSDLLVVSSRSIILEEI